jgi:hypothetical protein
MQEVPGTKQTDQADDNQINRNNHIQQSGDHEYQNSGYQRNNRNQIQGNVHGIVLQKIRLFPG